MAVFAMAEATVCAAQAMFGGQEAPRLARAGMTLLLPEQAQLESTVHPLHTYVVCMPVCLSGGVVTCCVCMCACLCACVMCPVCLWQAVELPQGWHPLLEPADNDTH